MYTIKTLSKRLGIQNPMTCTTCIGYSQQKQTCGIRVGKEWRESAATKLQVVCDVLNKEGYTSGLAGMLEDIAKGLHCQRYHQGQAASKAQELMFKLVEFRAGVDGAQLAQGTAQQARRTSTTAPLFMLIAQHAISQPAPNRTYRVVDVPGWQSAAPIARHRTNPQATPAIHATGPSTPGRRNQNNSRPTADVEISSPVSASLSPISHTTVSSRSQPHPCAPQRKSNHPAAPRSPPAALFQSQSLSLMPTKFLLEELYNRYNWHPQAMDHLGDFTSIVSDIEGRKRGVVSSSSEQGRRGSPSVYFDAVS